MATNSNWNFKFYRVDPTVEKDSETTGRFTFNVYYYFQPAEYKNWSSGNQIQNMTYSAELISHPSFPKIGTDMPAPLDSFYIRDIISIENLNEEDNPQAVSYAVVTVECENKKSTSAQAQATAAAKASSSFVMNASKADAKPWEREVDDFTITPVPVSIPMVQGYDDNGNLVPVETTAHQPIQGLTTETYNLRLTWTYYTKNSTGYGSSMPILNSSPVTVDTVSIPTKFGLLLPPARRKLWYYEDENDTNPEAYYAWSFEILVAYNSFGTSGHKAIVANAGTQALDDSGNAYDICAWYIVDPQQEYQPTREVGSPQQMILAKKQVDAKNKTRTPEQQITFTGDFVQTQLPITQDGKIQSDDGTRLYIGWYKFEAGSWKLGGM